MVRFPRLLSIALLAASLLVAAPPAVSQDPGRSIVSIYRIAPGKQLDFLKWMAAREPIDRAAGVPATKWYVHRDGDSWDYVGIAPYNDDATGDRLDAMARKQGLTAGPRAGLELRELMASHTDTISAGPFSAAELVDRASKP
jgi:hypothetical protein